MSDEFMVSVKTTLRGRGYFGRREGLYHRTFDIL